MHVPDACTHARPLEIRLELLEVGSCARPPLRGHRVLVSFDTDRSRRSRASGAALGKHDRRPAVVAADLDDPRARREACGTVVEQARLLLGSASRRFPRPNERCLRRSSSAAGGEAAALQIVDDHLRRRLAGQSRATTETCRDHRGSRGAHRCACPRAPTFSPIPSRRSVFTRCTRQGMIEVVRLLLATAAVGDDERATALRAHEVEEAQAGNPYERSSRRRTGPARTARVRRSSRDGR